MSTSVSSLKQRRLSANLSFLFTEWPFMERFRAAAEAGFTCVEFLFPYDHAADQVAEQLTRHGLDLSVFNAPPGDWARGDRGLAALPDRVQEFRESLDLALHYAKVLHAKRLHILAGIADPNDELARHTYLSNLELAVDRAREANLQVLIEPINGKDMPGYFLCSFADAASIVRQLDSEQLRLQFDLYHCQLINGSILDWLDALLPITSHLQIAGVPDRHEPDASVMPLAGIFDLLDRRAYAGRVGCEYRPRGATLDGLAWIESLQDSLT